MPNFTKYYNLPYIPSGLQTSASSDKERFTKIDNLLGFFSLQIGDGVASGLNVSDTSILGQKKVSVSSGFGMINKNICHIYNDLLIDINSLLSYLYFQKKNGVVQGFSGFSNKVSSVYNDISVPNNITGLSVSSYSFNNINLTWTENSDIDLKDYIIYRSSDNITYLLIGLSLSNQYIDKNITLNVTYYYKVKARDVNSNISTLYSSTVSVTVPYSTLKPNPVDNLISFPLNNAIQLFWDGIQNVTFNISVQRIDINGNDIGPQYNYSSLVNNILISSLTNSYIYRISVTSVSLGSISSDPIFLINSPEILSNVLVKNISVVQSMGSSLLSINLFISFEDNLLYPLVASTKYKIEIIYNNYISTPLVISTKSINLLSYDSIKIKSRTNYIIKITGIDINDNLGSPVFYQLKTENFKNPNPITLLSGIIDKNKLYFTWNNSNSLFLYNKIKLTKYNGLEVILLNDTNICKNNNYHINSILLDSVYTITLSAIDLFGNLSQKNSISINSPLTSSVNIYPLVPIVLHIYSNDGYVYILWSSNENDSQYINLYYIWRSIYKQPIIYSDFSLIATVSSDDKSFKDYGVENNIGYYYFITSGDVFGNKSKNPIDNQYIKYGMKSAYPHDNISFSSPSGLLVEITDNSASLSWNRNDDLFDGYLILKSYNNIYDFKTIGYVKKLEISYTDYNGILLSGTYYYTIRKVRQGGRLYLSLSLNIVPYFSIILAKIDNSGLSLVISSLSNNISLDNILILSINQDKINLHKHLLTSSDDSRIDISNNTVVSSFTTVDLLSYKTDLNILLALDYIVRINNINSNIIYSLDINSGIIYFNLKLSLNDVVSLLCVGLNLIKNILPKEKINKLFATNITNNLLKKLQIIKINHNGRSLLLLPLCYKMTSLDRIDYSIFQNNFISLSNPITKLYINTGVTFYDILFSGDISLLLWLSLTLKLWITMDLLQWLWLDLFSVSSLIAATSSGIMISIDDGATWKLVFLSNIPVQRIYRASNGSLFIAVKNLIYISLNGASWTRTLGYLGCLIVRDFTDDGNNVYASTDSGVFKFNLSQSDGFEWIKTSTLNAFSSLCYGIYYSNFRSELNVCNLLGIYRSSNEGVDWTLDNDNINDIVYRFNVILSLYNEYVYAVTIDGLFRKSYLDSDFLRINKYKFINSLKVLFLNKRLIITTDNGFLISDPVYDATIDSDIVFNKITELGTSSNAYDSTCLKVINGHELVLGTDQILFATVDFNNYYLLFSNTLGKSPTIYVNDKKVSTHVYCSRDYVIFNNKKRIEDSVKVANQYKFFVPKNGTWILQNYISDINIYINNNKDFFITKNNISSLISASLINNYIFLTFTLKNSNSTRANAYLSLFISLSSRFKSIVNGNTSLLKTGLSVSQVFSSSLYKFHQTNSQLLGNVKYYSLIDSSNLYFDNLIFSLNNLKDILYKMIPYISGYLLDSNVKNGEKCTVDIMGGLFNFSELKSKYDLMLVILSGTLVRDIGDNSHSDILNKISLVDSGLNFKLSNINNYNLIVNRILLDRKSNNLSLPLVGDLVSNFNYIGGASVISEWYDKINSTIDYVLQENIPLSKNIIEHVFCAKKINNSIWVGGIGGLMFIDSSDPSIRDMIDFNNNLTVVDIFLNDNGVYVLTLKLIFFTEDYVNFIKITNNNIYGVYKRIISIKNTLVIFTSYGNYYLEKNSNTWTSSDYINNIQDVIVHDKIYAFNDNKLYFSNDGILWSFKKLFSQNINAIIKLKNLIIAGTSVGVQSDNATFYSNNPLLTTLDIIGNLIESSGLIINNIVHNYLNNNIIAGDSNGKYYILLSGIWTLYDDSNLNSISKIVYSGNKIWFFNRNMFKYSDSTNFLILSVC